MNTILETRKIWFAKGFRGAFTKPLATYREAIRYPVNQDEGLDTYGGMLAAATLWMLVVFAVFNVGTALILPTPAVEMIANRIAELIAFVPPYGLLLLAHLRWGIGEIARRLFR